MDLRGLLTSLKKKIDDSWSGIGQGVQQGVKNLYDNQGLFQRGRFTPQAVIPAAQNALQSFGQNFPRATQQFLKLEQPVQRVSSFLQQPYKPIQIPQVQTKYPGINALGNYLVKPVIQGVVNFPTNYIGGITKTGLDLGRIDRGEKVPFRKLAGDIGQTGGAILDVSVLPFGVSTGKNIAIKASQNTLKTALKEGTVSGAKYGGAYGLLEGLASNRDTQNLLNYTKNIIGSTALGTAGGAVLGGGIGGIGYTAGKVFNSIVKGVKKIKGVSDEEAIKISKLYIRDEWGRFAGKDTPQYYKDPYLKPKEVRELRKSLGLPEEGVKASDIPMGLSTKPIGGNKAILNAEQLKAKKKLPGIMYEDKFIKGLEKDKIKLGQGIKIIKPEEIPNYTKEQLNQIVGESQFRSVKNKDTFKNLFSKWIGQRNAADLTGMEVGSRNPTPKNIKGVDIIQYIENPNQKAPTEVKSFVKNLRQEYDRLFVMAQESGVDVNYLKNYITHIWDRPQEEVARLYKTVGTRFGFSKDRILPTYEEGIRMGLKPKYSEPSQLIATYTKKLEQMKANLEFVKGLKDKGFIVPKRTMGFEPITAPGFIAPTIKLGDQTIREGVYYAPPEIARAINKVFSGQTSAFSIPANISSKLQDIALSGGVPKTPVNAWTLAQITKEITSGRIKSPIKAIWTSLSESNSNRYFSENAQYIREQQLNNIPFSSSYNINNLAPKSFVEKVLGKNLEDFWNKTVNEPTFKRFMPILQTEFYKDVKNSALKSGKSATEAINIASQATKNFYGLTSTADTAMRGRLGKDLTSTFLFAPRYRESMINFWVNNLKALKNPFALENRANAKFLVGATLTALAYDQLNRLFNNGRSMVENPPGTEDKLLIPVGNGEVIGVPFLSSIATVPRGLARQGLRIVKGDLSGAIKDAGQTYLSIGFKPLADVAANQDYFGKQIVEDNATTAEKYKSIGSYLLNQYISHPYLKEMFNAKNQKDPAYQRLSRAMELPFRFYTDKSIQSKYYYGAKDTAVKGLSDIEQQAYNAIPKYDTDDPNTTILKYQTYLTYPKVFEAKQKIELEMARQTGKAIDPLYLVDYETAKKYMRYETLPPGSQDRKDMTKTYPELVALFDVRGKYFDENPIPTLTQSNRPLPSAYVQQQMDAKNWSDPQVQAYLDANTQYQNDQRAKLGLPSLSGGYGPKKITINKTPAPKFKVIRPKSVKIKLSKFKPTKITKAKKAMFKITYLKKKKGGLKIKA